MSVQQSNETIVAPVLDTETTSRETISSVAVGKDDVGNIDTRTSVTRRDFSTKSTSLLFDGHLNMLG